MTTAAAKPYSTIAPEPAQMRELQREGVRLFNARDFYEAHEAWEEVWRHSQGHDSRFWQGLIQAAASLLHWTNGNFDGARRLAVSAIEKLESVRDEHATGKIAGATQVPIVFHGIKLAQFLDEFTGLTKPLVDAHITRNTDGSAHTPCCLLPLALQECPTLALADRDAA